MLASPLALVAGTARAEPTKDDCADANESAQALRASGRLREATGKLAVCVDRACPALVRKDCIERLDEVQRALPTVVFAVRGARGDDLEAVAVKIDGTLLTSVLGGGAIPVDPGAHRFTFESLGFRPFQQEVLVQEGEKGRTVAVVLQASDEARVEDPNRGRNVRRWIGLSGAVGGLVGLGIGGALGLVAKSQFDSAAQESGARQHDDSVKAVDTGNVATVFVVAGSVLMVGGAVLWLTTPAPSTRVALGPTQVSLAGTF